MFPLKIHKANLDSVRLSADYLNTIAEMLNNVTIQVVSGNAASISKPNQWGQGWVFNVPSGSGATFQNVSFDIYQSGVSVDGHPVATVKRGYFCLQGQSPIDSAQTDLEIIGGTLADPVFVYLEAQDGTTTPLILQQVGGNYPMTIPGVWRKVLYEVREVGPEGILEVIWDRRPDFCIGSPI